MKLVADSIDLVNPLQILGQGRPMGHILYLYQLFLVGTFQTMCSVFQHDAWPFLKTSSLIRKFRCAWSQTDFFIVSCLARQTLMISRSDSIHGHSYRMDWIRNTVLFNTVSHKLRDLAFDISHALDQTTTTLQTVGMAKTYKKPENSLEPKNTYY